MTWDGSQTGNSEVYGRILSQELTPAPTLILQPFSGQNEEIIFSQNKIPFQTKQAISIPTWNASFFDYSCFLQYVSRYFRKEYCSSSKNSQLRRVLPP